MNRVFRNSLTALLVIAFVVRLAAGWAWQSRIDGPFGMGDSQSYWDLGRSIAEGKPYAYGAEQARVFRTPGYPILLAPILWAAGDGRDAVLLARAEAALLGMLAVVGVWGLTRLLFDDRAALIAAAFATVYPGAIALSVFVLSEAPFCPLMLLQLILWTIAWKSPNRRRATFFGLCSGLAGGAATLVRPSWLLFTPLAAAIGLSIGRPNGPTQAWGGDRGRQAWIGVCLVTGLVAVMWPWWVRNAWVTGHFVPTTLQVGASLYDGLNPDATGASNMDFVSHFAVEERSKAGGPEATEPDSFEMRLDRRLRAEAIAWAKANPGRALRLAGVKFLRMWNVWPNERQFSSWPLRLVVLFTYTPLLFFAIIGAYRTLGRGWPYILCWLPAVYFTLLHMVFVSSIRYREPAMLALLVLAAGGMRGIRDWGLGIRDSGFDCKNTHPIPNHESPPSTTEGLSDSLACD